MSFSFYIRPLVDIGSALSGLQKRPWSGLSAAAALAPDVESC